MILGSVQKLTEMLRFLHAQLTHLALVPLSNKVSSSTKTLSLYLASKEQLDLGLADL